MKKLLIALMALATLTVSTNTFAEDCSEIYKNVQKELKLKGALQIVTIALLPAGALMVHKYRMNKKFLELLKEVEENNLEGKRTKYVLRKIGGNVTAQEIHDLVNERNYYGPEGLCQPGAALVGLAYVEARTTDIKGFIKLAKTVLR